MGPMSAKTGEPVDECAKDHVDRVERCYKLASMGMIADQLVKWSNSQAATVNSFWSA